MSAIGDIQQDSRHADHLLRAIATDIHRAARQMIGANISEHISNIYEQGELIEKETVRKIRTVQKEGKRMVNRTKTYYNLDAIATIYTRQLSQQQQLDIQRHNQQYPPISVNYCQRNHDRFLIIDDVVYLFGASLKDAGKKLFAYIKMQETAASELLNHIR